ncbi:MAG: PTS sugar transporter subunit IIA [Alphaproteobacteria bacterium GM202ARS2]|nr:PTS sugar transporter subunit IIA [Alphaproteobacteria bacterium GM202ARS2]
MDMQELMQPKNVCARVSVASKKQLLQEIAKHMTAVVGCPEQRIFDILLERERLGSTGMGNGIAIPHGKLSDIKRIHGMLLTVQGGVDFDAPDDKPVDLICALIAPEDAGGDHLRALAMVSRFLRDPEKCAAMRRAEGNEDLWRIICG